MVLMLFEGPACQYKMRRLTVRLEETPILIIERIIREYIQSESAAKRKAKCAPITNDYLLNDQRILTGSREEGFGPLIAESFSSLIAIKIFWHFFRIAGRSKPVARTHHYPLRSGDAPRTLRVKRVLAYFSFSAPMILPYMPCPEFEPLQIQKSTGGP